MSDALALADAMAAEGGPKMWRGVSPVPAPNWDWLDAQALAATARYYVGANREAWRRLQPLVDGAPALSFLRSAKAQIASARGWPRLADEETHIAAALTPRINPPRSRSPRRRSRESATTRPGSAPRRSSRSFPATRPWSGCAAACARTMPRSCASTRSPAPSTATRPTVPARATTSDRRCWRRRSPNAGASRPRTSSRRPAPSRASSGGPAMARASRRTGPMHRSTRRSGSTGEPSTARACALPAHGRLATTCSWRAWERATRPTRRCARPTTGSPPTAAAAASATPGTRPRSPPRPCGAGGSPTATTGSRRAAFSRPASWNGRTSASSCARSCGGVRTRGSMPRISIPAGAPPPT